MVYNYLRNYTNYFWQWEDKHSIIAIKDSVTVVFTEHLKEIIDTISHQGLPSFSSLLLTISATNVNGSVALSKAEEQLKTIVDVGNSEIINSTFHFLYLLSELPIEYKSGEKRILVLRAIFENSHNLLSVKKSKSIASELTSYPLDNDKLTSTEEIYWLTIYNELRCLELLNRKFKTTQDILKKISSLPDLTEEIEEFLPTTESNDESLSDDDFIEKLLQNYKTKSVGALIKRIWSGLNLSFYSANTSDQLIGGVADLSNKGQLDQLLISEFANDDLIFLSRLANNEALYTKRENPPSAEDHERVILIDISIYSWGNPRVISFAILMALAKHPKSNYNCRAYVVGHSFTSISTETMSQLFDALQLVDANLTCEHGIKSFFEKEEISKTDDVIFITNDELLTSSDGQRLLATYSDKLSHLISCSSLGEINIYQSLKSGRKHIQNFHLPLSELWQNSEPEKKLEHIDHTFIPADLTVPILVCKPFNQKALLTDKNGDVYVLTSQKTLLKLYDPLSLNYGISSAKGWELLMNNLPHCSEVAYIITDNQEQTFIFTFHVASRNIVLINVDTRSYKKIYFPHWKSRSRYRPFFFQDNSFHHFNTTGCWSISLSGEIQEIKKQNVIEQISNLEKETTSPEKSKLYLPSISFLKNIKQVKINTAGLLCLNQHQYDFHEKFTSFVLKKIRNLNVADSTKSIAAKKINSYIYEFPDKSQVITSTEGVIILKSSNPNLEDIYLPTALETQLGVSCDNFYAGNGYYYKEKRQKIKLTHVGENRVKLTKLIIEQLKINLNQANEHTLHLPTTLSNGCSSSIAKRIKENLEIDGVNIELLDLPHEKELTLITVTKFYKKYIQEYINTIKKHVINS